MIEINLHTDMKKTLFILSAFVFTALTAFAAENTEDNRVLLTIDGEPATVGEFMYIYQKNNSASQAEDQRSLQDYLDLFVNYRLKVKAAQEAGIDTTEAFRKELAGYRSQTTPQYMVNKQAEEAIVQKAYGRMLNDRLVRHIAVQCTSHATPEEEAEALAKIQNAYQRVTTGLPVKVKGKIKPGKVEDFAKVAADVSEDPSVAENDGLVGWVTPFRFVYPFEEAAYTTEVGAVSNVFRTPFGYHILKVEDEKPHVEIHAEHIMKMTPRGDDSLSLVAKQQIDSLYQLALSGADFEELARLNSEDRGSAQRGGDLGWFGKGRMVPEFEKAAFALQDEGDISTPVQSPYGWHIIKLLGRRGTPDLAEIRADVLKQIRRSEYQKQIDEAFIQGLKETYSFSENPDALAPFYALAEKYNVRDSAFLAEAAAFDGVLFAYADKQRTASDFAAFLAQNTFSQQTAPEAILAEKYNQFVEKCLREQEDSQLENKYPDFRNLMCEYHDGTLLFEISLREVWQKAGQDTVGLNAFFSQHKQHYMWDEPRFKGYVVYCKDKNTAKVAKRILQSANPDSVASYLNTRLNLDSVTYVHFDKGLFKLGDNAAVDKYVFKKGDYKPDQEYPVVFVSGKQLKGAEEPADERGKVIAAYQDYLEKQWLERLHKEHEVKINEEVFQSLLK
ncbi:MAG TPA: hypothetical protein DIW30_07980 [Bacteroidales bacterium]|nr:hypothetical protein [Bacteroidales bacterium]